MNKSKCRGCRMLRYNIKYRCIFRVYNKVKQCMCGECLVKITCGIACEPLGDLKITMLEGVMLEGKKIKSNHFSILRQLREKRDLRERRNNERNN